jgi:hypothetical protein
MNRQHYTDTEITFYLISFRIRVYRTTSLYNILDVCQDALTRVPKCIDVDGGIFENELH